MCSMWICRNATTKFGRSHGQAYYNKYKKYTKNETSPLVGYRLTLQFLIKESHYGFFFCSPKRKFYTKLINFPDDDVFHRHEQKKIKINEKQSVDQLKNTRLLLILN